jgi:hypothetical protein
MSESLFRHLPKAGFTQKWPSSQSTNSVIGSRTGGSMSRVDLVAASVTSRVEKGTPNFQKMP